MTNKITVIFFLLALTFGCGFENLHEAVEVDPSSYKPGAFELFLGQRKPSRGFDVAATSDGNYVIAGETKQATGNASDAILIKIDDNGVEVWDQHLIVGGTENETGKAISVSPNNHLIVTGTKSVDGVGKLYFISAFSDGSLRSEAFKSNGTSSTGNDILPLADGSYLFTGAINLCGANAICDHFLFYNLDDEDNIDQVSDGYGSGTNTVGNGIALAGNGGILAVGNQFDNSSNSIDIYLVFQNVSSLDDFPATEVLSEPGDQFARATAALSDNSYAVIGHTDNNSNGPTDLLYFRVNQELSLINMPVLIGGAGTDRGNDIALTNDGNLIIVGETTSSGAGGSDVYLVKANTDGSVIWEKTYGGAFKDVGEAVVQTPDGGYLIIGHSQLTSDPENVAIYVIKTDSNGDLR